MRKLFAAAVSATIPLGHAVADEGLWTFENFPAERAGAAYGFAPDKEWLDRVRAAAVSLDGCSASIVGSRGLVLTNHHCVEPCIEALAADGQDVSMEPILARSLAEERQCPGQEATVVTDIVDVTARVLAARQGLDTGEAQQAGELEMERIKAECEAEADDRKCVVASYHSDRVFTLYVQRKWTDVRLVLGPESAAGFFGGDLDNFNFPRFALDAAFLRLYENGEPAHTPQRLRMRAEPLQDGEPVFVAGYPGETGRNDSLARIEYYLDSYFPVSLAIQAEVRGRLLSMLARPDGVPRGFETLLSSTENVFKHDWAELSALRSPGFMDALRAREEKLRSDIAARPDLAEKVGDAWAEIERATDAYRAGLVRRTFLENMAGGGSTLGHYAREIVRAASEAELPEDQRQPGYSDASIESLKEQFAQEDVLFPERETFMIGFWLSKLREHLTVDHPVTRAVLGKESPEAVASRAVAETRLGDPAERVRLLEGGSAAVASSDDPLIRLMAAIEPEARALMTRHRREEQALLIDASGRIDEARSVLYGDVQYPDAVSTLRLNYGAVEGWTEPDGREIVPFTTFAGLFERETGIAPFKLAPLWDAARGRLDPDTILNVSTNNDTVGGNSGSPVIDREGRVVGAMFDGNIYSMGGYYMFDPALNRSVIAASTGILHALDVVYGMDHVLAELAGD